MCIVNLFCAPKLCLDYCVHFHGNSYVKYFKSQFSCWDLVSSCTGVCIVVCVRACVRAQWRIIPIIRAETFCRYKANSLIEAFRVRYITKQLSMHLVSTRTAKLSVLGRKLCLHPRADNRSCSCLLFKIIHDDERRYSFDVSAWFNQEQLEGWNM